MMWIAIGGRLGLYSLASSAEVDVELPFVAEGPQSLQPLMPVL